MENILENKKSWVEKSGVFLTQVLILMICGSIYAANARMIGTDALSSSEYRHVTQEFDYLYMERETGYGMEEQKATRYVEFREGVHAYFQEDYTEAMSKLRPLAETGYSSAQFYLALMYDQGHGVIQNHAIAVKWYRKAAEQGHIDAQYNLGIAYASGQGVKKNIHTAIYWWKRAATYGSIDAQYNLGMVYTTGKGIMRNAMLAVKWWTKAASKGDVAALFNLGVVYINGGDGVTQNLCEASRLWKISAEQGFNRAKTALRMLHSMQRYRASCFDVTAKK